MPIRCVCIVINYKSVSSLDKNECKFYSAPALEVSYLPILQINTYFVVNFLNCNTNLFLAV